MTNKYTWQRKENRVIQSRKANLALLINRAFIYNYTIVGNPIRVDDVQNTHF